MFPFVDGEGVFRFWFSLLLVGSIFIWVWVSLCLEHVALSLLDPCSVILWVSYILVLWMRLGITSSNFRIGQF